MTPFLAGFAIGFAIGVVVVLVWAAFAEAGRADDDD